MIVILQKVLIALIVDMVTSSSVDRQTNTSETGEIRRVGRGLKIYQGVPDFAFTVPYVACLRMITKDYNFFCTGAIIHKSWVLTAAHCYKLDHSVNEVTMVAGHFDYHADSLLQKRTAERIVIHPKFKTLDDDIYDFLLLKVEPFKLGDKLKIIALSDTPWPSGDKKYKQSCIIAGWGHIKPGVSSPYITWHKVIAKHGSRGCKCLSRDANRNLICLDHTKKSRPCADGDTGGTLVCDGKAVGVAHRGYMPEQCDPTVTKKPELSCKSSIESYMFICHELSWIASHVPGIPATPVYCSSSSISIALPLTIITILIQTINFI